MSHRFKHYKSPSPIQNQGTCVRNINSFLSSYKGETQRLTLIILLKLRMVCLDNLSGHFLQGRREKHCSQLTRLQHLSGHLLQGRREKHCSLLTRLQHLRNGNYCAGCWVFVANVGCMVCAVFYSYIYLYLGGGALLVGRGCPALPLWLWVCHMWFASASIFVCHQTKGLKY